ncbi:MAG TPA: hypothetical protein VIR57_07145 [Chloroflexota bacterium]|jgi:hypothetical protein
MRIVLAALVALLTLAVGILHFALDFVLFGGRFVSTGPPPGAPAGNPPPGPSPGSIAKLIGPRLPELFVANLVVFVVLAIVFLAASRARPRVRMLVDVLIVLATVATLAGWNGIGRPNPRGLGRWAVTIEFALIAAALVHALIVSRRARLSPSSG